MDKNMEYNPKREGFIGRDRKEEVEVLFILKEPNSSGEEGVWFRDCVYEKKIENKYYRTLGILADLLMGDKAGGNTHSNLGKCGYMNVYPCSGGPTASLNYEKTINDAVILKGRLDSCFKKLNPKMVVTCLGNYDAIFKLEKYKSENYEDHFLYKRDTKEDRKFNSCTICVNGKRIPMYEFYHPAARVRKDRERFDLQGGHL
ncbi:hypothetical protein [Ohessyouella blattaphilus]|nr:hypothetical protein [Lachnospiraceae bacterium OttesenSCG-928-J05]